MPNRFPNIISFAIRVTTVGILFFTGPINRGFDEFSKLRTFDIQCGSAKKTGEPLPERFPCFRFNYCSYTLFFAVAVGKKPPKTMQNNTGQST